MPDKVWSMPIDTLNEFLNKQKQILEKGMSAEQAKLFFDFFDDDSNEAEVHGGVAVIKIEGPLRKGRSFFAQSMDSIRINIQDALTNDKIKGIVLDIDSPGGSVNGTEELASFIFEAREIKPIVSFTSGSMTSAALWIGTAANKVISQKTATIGSIGVVMVHADFSEMDKKMGVNVTVLTAGKEKAVGSDAKPLSASDKKIIQNQLNTIHGIFIDAVAKNRGVSAETIRASAGEAQIFIGEDAITAGLSDQIGSLDDAVELALSLSGSVKNKPKLLNRNKTKLEGGVKGMSLETLKTDDPTAYDEVMVEAKAKVDAEIKAKAGEDAVKLEAEEKSKADEEAKKLEAEKLVKAGADTQIKELTTSVTKLTDSVGVLTDENKKLQKTEIIRKEQDLKTEAGEIWEEMLSESEIPERFYTKGSGMVSYSKYLVESEGADDVLDVEKFTEAIKAEISDWENKGMNSNGEVQGFGASVRTSDGIEPKITQTEKAEDDVVDRLRAHAGLKVVENK